MKITLDLTKSLEENASFYFEKAKQAKQKAERARKALKTTKINLEKAKLDLENKKTQLDKKPKVKRKKEWFEKFRWFYTSEDFLVIAGRDATTNEIIIKKHTEKDDVVFHTEVSGSPFGVIKTEKKKPGKISLEETAQFIGCYSKVWKGGQTALDVFYVNPEQVTKEAPSGEYIGKGSFMIYGKKNIMPVALKLYIGIMDDGKVMSGPLSAVKKHCKKYKEIIQGNDKASNIAKSLKKEFETDDVDEIVRIIPVGSKLKKER